MRRIEEWLSVILVLLVVAGSLIFPIKSNAGQLGNYPATATLASADIVPVIIVLTNQNETINWYNFKELMSKNINWTDITSQIPNQSMNWTDIQRVQKTTSGVNWTYLDIVSGGMNWTAVANNASSGQVFCYKSTGQPGKCSGTITSGICGTCS
jgi:hypothetical protein